jgi:hypothetical protein
MNCQIYREMEIDQSDGETGGEMARAVCYRVKGFFAEGGYPPFDAPMFYKAVGLGYCIPDNLQEGEESGGGSVDENYYYYGNEHSGKVPKQAAKYLVPHTTRAAAARLVNITATGFYTEQKLAPYPTGGANPAGGIDPTGTDPSVTMLACSVECNRKLAQGW